MACLENSTSIQVAGPVTLFNGTLIVLALPNLDLSNPPVLQGDVTVPYRVQAVGTVTDSAGNAWSNAQIIEDDARGPIAIRFQLLSGQLGPNTTINLQDIRVCQRISDGPGPVVLRVGIWGVLDKNKQQRLELVQDATNTMKAADRFITCSEGTNSAPIPKSATYAVSPFLDTVPFNLDALDPETPTSSLLIAIETLPEHGTVTVTEGGFAFVPSETWSGLNELVFRVDDGENVVHGRIGFFMDDADAALAFTGNDGLAIVGEVVEPLELDTMVASERPYDLRFALDGAYFEGPLNPNTLSEGLHRLRAEVIDQQSRDVLATRYRYIYRRIESAETYLEVTGSSASAGQLINGIYGDLEVHDYDNQDAYSFQLLGNQYSDLIISGIQNGTLKMLIPSGEATPWYFEKPLERKRALELKPGATYQIRVETKTDEDAQYSLGLRKKFPRTSIPLLDPTDRCFVQNPNDQSVILNWVEWPSGVAHQSVIGPYSMQEMSVLTDSSSSALTMTSSLPIVTAIETTSSGDLDIVSQGPSAFSACILPHLAAQTSTWRNRFTFATHRPTDLNWVFGNGLTAQGRIEGAGSFAYEFPSYIPTPEMSWTTLTTSSSAEDAFVNGYLSFSHRSGHAGSASVAPLNIDRFEPGIAARTYFIPHVAADTALFWTGYSLLNPDPSRVATAILYAYDSQGNQLDHESVTLAAGHQDIAVIGEDRFGGIQPAWIRIDSSLPLIGVELLGGSTAAQPYLAGLELPSIPSAKLAFPRVTSEDDRWTGIAILNAGPTIADVEIQFRQADGNIALQSTMRIAPNARTTVLAPAGFSGTAICRERLSQPQLIGFALVGSGDRTKLAGYTAY